MNTTIEECIESTTRAFPRKVGFAFYQVPHVRNRSDRLIALSVSSDSLRRLMRNTAQLQKLGIDE
jgi:hypothetical protein